MVDGDVRQQEAARQALLSLAAVDIASDGLEALLRIEQVKPDVLVTELLLAQLEGIQFLRALKSRPDTQAIPIIVATARDDPSTMIEATALGIGGYLTKPYLMSELFYYVGRVLSALPGSS